LSAFNLLIVSLADKVNEARQRPPSSQISFKLGGEHEDVTESTAVSVNDNRHFGEENEFHSTENLATIPEPCESSGRWTQHSDPTESVGYSTVSSWG